MAFNDIFTVFKNSPLPSDEEIEKIPSFMFCRFLSTNQYTIMAANEFNKFHKEIPTHLQYKMVKQVFKGKNIYCSMPKKLPEETSLDNLCEYFKISRSKANEYITFMSPQEIEAINNIYKFKGKI